MNPSRRLSLKREALQGLSPEELDDVVAGTVSDRLQTMMSCLDYITCFPCLPETFICPE